MTKEYTHLEMEAALCIWEFLLEQSMKEDNQWSKLRQNIGSVELRHASLPIGKWCLRVYDLCTKDNPDYFEGMSYDWEVIPLLMSFVTALPDIHCPDEAETADAVRRYVNRASVILVENEYKWDVFRQVETPEDPQQPFDITHAGEFETEEAAHIYAKALCTSLGYLPYDYEEC